MSTNSYQYTGREDDGTGLYYYRSRYYSSTQQRFISEDPIRLAGGTNLYQYAASCPNTYADPSGHNPLLIGCAYGAAMYVDFRLLPQLFVGRKQPSWSHIARNLATSCLSGATFGLFGEVLGPLLEAMQGLGPAAEESEALTLDAADSWGKPNTLDQHFVDHAADFGNSTPEGYANQASDFLQESQANNYPTQIDPTDGTIRTYDPNTNTFGAYNANGTTKTFYKPTSVNGYFPKPQWGSAPWVP